TQSQTPRSPAGPCSDHIIHFSAPPSRSASRRVRVPCPRHPQTPFSSLSPDPSPLCTPLGCPRMSRASTAIPPLSSSRTPVENGTTAADNVVRTKILLLGMRRCVHPCLRPP